jgi:hypothetical protein
MDRKQIIVAHAGINKPGEVLFWIGNTPVIKVDNIITWGRYLGNDIMNGGGPIYEASPAHWEQFRLPEETPLQAAAPELLAALEETHAALCFTPNYIGTAQYKANKYAIAKAYDMHNEPEQSYPSNP